jgi:hypothetical protein
MIRNLMGEMVEFDLEAARKLDIVLKEWALKDARNLPYELSALVFSTWGYEAALAEIEYLRKEPDDRRKT